MLVWLDLDGQMDGGNRSTFCKYYFVHCPLPPTDCLCSRVQQHYKVTTRDYSRDRYISGCTHTYLTYYNAQYLSLYSLLYWHCPFLSHLISGAKDNTTRGSCSLWSFTEFICIHPPRETCCFYSRFSLSDNFWRPIHQPMFFFIFCRFTT